MGLFLIGLLILALIIYKVLHSKGIYLHPPEIDIGQVADWSQLVIAYAAVFAILQYAIAFADIADRKTKTVLEFVKFFRETVLGQSEAIKKHLKKERIGLPEIVINKNTPYFKFTDKEFFTRIAPHKNIELVRGYENLMAENIEVEQMVTACLNAAEEFAISIINSKSQNHRAVSSIKKPFVELMEQFAVPLYFQIGMANDSFSYVAELYRDWKEDVGFSPRTKEDRLEQFTERLRQFRSQ